MACRVSMGTVGEAHAGGSAGSFLRLQLFNEEACLGNIVLASASSVQYTEDDSAYVLPIIDGAWSEAQWEQFCNQLSD